MQIAAVCSSLDFGVKKSMRLVHKKAEISACGLYRYTLWRCAEEDCRGDYVLFVGLNPSVADASIDDPTVRRCIGFAEAWGFDSLCMCNLFAYRATDPAELNKAIDPIGPENDTWIVQLANHASLVVAAWGNGGMFLQRDVKVLTSLHTPIHCLGTTKSGKPRHPLYVKKSQRTRLLSSTGSS